MVIGSSSIYLCYLFVDVATVVGYLIVCRPFLNLNHPRHLNSTHAEMLEVGTGLDFINKLSTCYIM